MTVELSGGDVGDIRDAIGEGLAAEEAPPPCDHVQPCGANRNEGMLDARAVRQSVPEGYTQMAGQIVGDEAEIALRIGPLSRNDVPRLSNGFLGNMYTARRVVSWRR